MQKVYSRHNASQDSRPTCIYYFQKRPNAFDIPIEMIAECRELILVLYKRLVYELVQANRSTGDCDRDLKRWLQSKEEDGDSLALEELQHALIELGGPALAQRRFCVKTKLYYR